MKQSKNSAATKTLLMIPVLVGCLFLLKEAKPPKMKLVQTSYGQQSPLKAHILSNNGPKKIERPSLHWDKLEARLLRLDPNSQEDVDALSQEAEEWIQVDQPGFEKAYKSEIHNDEHFNMIKSFFLTDIMLEHAENKAELVMAVLSHESLALRDSHHTMGNINHLKTHLLERIHSTASLIDELKNDSQLIQELKTIVSNHKDLAVVRSSLRLLQKLEDAPSEQLAHLVEKRNPLDTYAYKDLL